MTFLRPVVVGYDGSDGAKDALRVAAREAEAHGVGLKIVAVWHPARVNAAAIALTPSPASDFSAYLEHSTLAILDEAQAALLEHAPSLPTEKRLVKGHAAGELTRESRGATMLVVGSRGQGRLAELILGSVSHECILHANCPVLVVPRTTHR